MFTLLKSPLILKSKSSIVEGREERRAGVGHRAMEICEMEVEARARRKAGGLGVGGNDTNLPSP